MKKPIIHFIISALIGLGIGYLAFDVIASGSNNDSEVASNTDATTETSAETTSEEETAPETTETATASGGENILQSKGCIGCHAVEGLDLQGGVTGPDLSKAYSGVEGKHGKPLDEFLKEPTSAVMSTVIAGSPLTDEEITQIVEELKKAEN